MSKILLEEILYVINDAHSAQEQLDDQFDPLLALRSIAVDVYTKGYVFKDFIDPSVFAVSSIKPFKYDYDLYIHLGGNPDALDWRDFLIEHPYAFKMIDGSYVYFDAFHEPIDREKIQQQSIDYLSEQFYEDFNVDIVAKTKIETSYNDGIVLSDEPASIGFGFMLKLKNGRLNYFKDTNIKSLEIAIDYVAYLISLYAKLHNQADEFYGMLMYNHDEFIYKKEEQ